MAAAGGGTPGSTPAPGRWGGLLQPLEAAQRSSGIIWHFSPHHPDRACGTARQRAHKEWDEEAFENDSRHQRERGPTALQWGGTNVLNRRAEQQLPTRHEQHRHGLERRAEHALAGMAAAGRTFRTSGAMTQNRKTSL